MLNNEKFDIFIAYHGNCESGSERAAREIYKRIEGAEVYEGKKLKAYFHPMTNNYGTYLSTPEFVQRTPMFLLVANGKIRRNDNGQICATTEEDTMGYLYEEVRAFHSSMYRLSGGANAVRVFTADGFSYSEAEALHPMFLGKTSLNDSTMVLDWIRNFYKGAYVERFYNERKRLAMSDFDAFKRGMWVPEARAIFEGLGYEGVGRCLLLYYIEKAKTGDSYAKECVKEMCEALKRTGCNDKNTKKMIVVAGRYM